MAAALRVRLWLGACRRAQSNRRNDWRRTRWAVVSATRCTRSLGRRYCRGPECPETHRQVPAAPRRLTWRGEVCVEGAPPARTALPHPLGYPPFPAYTALPDGEDWRHSRHAPRQSPGRGGAVTLLPVVRGGVFPQAASRLPPPHPPRNDRPVPRQQSLQRLVERRTQRLWLTRYPSVENQPSPSSLSPSAARSCLWRVCFRNKMAALRRVVQLDVG